ncbi:hypothetical protein L6R49_10540 [Myxococcota bacterium]|nr:hypothetical protein [Myxococcota bacterium]
MLRTAAQNKAIWSAVSQLRARGVPDDARDALLRRLVMEASGQASTKALTTTQAGAVIDGLNAELRRYATAPVAVAPAQRAVQAPEPRPAPPLVRQPRRTPRRDGRSLSPVHGRDDASPPTARQLGVLEALFVQAGFTSRTARMDWTTRQCGRPWPQNQLDLDALMVPLQEMVLRACPPADLTARLDQVLAQAIHLDAWLQSWAADVRGRLDRRGAAKVWTTHRLAKLCEAEAQVAAAQRVA